MRLETSCSSKSARCMKAEKFSPRPTGSKIVKRILPGGIEVSSRSIEACSDSIALARPASPAFSNSSEWSGSGKSSGRVNSVAGGFRRGSSGMPPRILANCTLICPKRTAAGVSRGRRPRGRIGRAPVGKQPLAVLADGFHRFDEAGDAGVPALGHLVPLALVLGLAGGEGLLAGLAQGGRLGQVAALHLAEQGRVFGIGLLQDLIAGGLDRGQPRRVGGLDLGRLALPPRKARAHRGKEPLVGPADLGPLAGVDGLQQALAVAFGHLQRGTAIQARFEHRPPQGQVIIGAPPPRQNIDRHADGKRRGR